MLLMGQIPARTPVAALDENLPSQDSASSSLLAVVCPCVAQHALRHSLYTHCRHDKVGRVTVWPQLQTEMPLHEKRPGGPA